jgi:hypothetical protein
MTKRINKSGYLSCFCSKEIMVKGYETDQLYLVNGLQVPLCKRWAKLTGYYSTIFSNGVKYIIVILNLLVRIFFIQISGCLDIYKQSSKFKFIETGVFFAVFF